MSRRQLGIGLVLLAGVLLGALREFLFLNLNYQIDFVQFDRRVSYAHSLFRSWVGGAGLESLLAIKWLLAAAYIGLMATLCIVLARLLWGDHRYRSIIGWGFASLSALALVFHWLSTYIPALGTASIHLLHGMQYPVVLFFLLAAAALKATKEH